MIISKYLSSFLDTFLIWQCLIHVFFYYQFVHKNNERGKAKHIPHAVMRVLNNQH